MNRITVALPTSLKFHAKQLARHYHISLAELIRRALRERISNIDGVNSDDAFFRDKDFYIGPAPRDLALNHDDYLCRT